MAKPEPLIRNEIRLDIIFSIIWNHRKRYLLPLFIVAVAAYALICCVPRTYSVSVKLAPEYGAGGGGGGMLANLASMADINLGEGNADAIVPTFYPDLMKSTDFVVPLLNVQVTTADGSFKGTYRKYLSSHCDSPWWSKLLATIKGGKRTAGADTVRINPFSLTQGQELLVKAASAGLSCTVDDKTDVITITTTAQDPLVAAQLADSVSVRLQKFITDYRTSKTRGELEDVREVLAEAKTNYEKKRDEYADFADRHQEVVLATYRIQLEDLENEMDIALNAYRSAKTQEQLAQAKLLSRTPAFTTLQNATVPNKPSGPKRMFFALGMVLIAFFVLTVRYVIKYKQTGDDGSKPTTKGVPEPELPEEEIETEPQP